MSLPEPACQTKTRTGSDTGATWSAAKTAAETAFMLNFTGGSVSPYCKSEGAHPEAGVYTAVISRAHSKGYVGDSLYADYGATVDWYVAGLAFGDWNDNGDFGGEDAQTWYQYDSTAKAVAETESISTQFGDADTYPIWVDEPADDSFPSTGYVMAAFQCVLRWSVTEWSP